MTDPSGAVDSGADRRLRRVRIGSAAALGLLLACIVAGSSGWAMDGEPGYVEDTLLMFVGEELDVLTIASRREESAWQAPAVAHVINRRELTETGARTLADALDGVPGFYMAEREWGTLPYLRGIPNGALILYDTVPMGSDSDKSYNQLGTELSLAAVKRIEIIRGPGSVLWGPDAFAGIVNVVPLTGGDVQGVETGLFSETPGEAVGGYVNAGYRRGSWDTFFSFSAAREAAERGDVNLTRFWDDEGRALPFEERLGEPGEDEERYLDTSARIGYGDRLSLSARISDNEVPYGVERAGDGLVWLEKRAYPVSFVKLEGRFDLTRSSAVRILGSHTWVDPELTVIDRTLTTKERTAYGEILFDKSFFFNSGLITAGAAYRHRRIEDAPFWSGGLPTFLGPENQLNAAPIVTGEDYETDLGSLFGQYSQKVGEMDLWAGLRYDSHDEDDRQISHNVGATWSPDDRWTLKLLYGTAYRTPYAQQLSGDAPIDMERVSSVNAQVAWREDSVAGFSVTGFFNRIEDHVRADPYAGTEFSLPNEQEFVGLEVGGEISPLEALTLGANLTLIDNRGPDERYHYNDFDFIREDGTLVPHFTDREYPYDAGADTLFNFTGNWRVTEDVNLFGRAEYQSGARVIDPLGGGVRDLSGLWLAHAALFVRLPYPAGAELTVSVRNLLDRDYEIPGMYAAMDGEPFTIRVRIGYRW